MSDLQHVEGLAQFAATMKTLPQTVSDKILRRSMFAGAMVFKKFVQAYAPVASKPVRRGNGHVTLPGTMRAAVIVKLISSQSGADQVQYIVTYRKGKAQQKSGRDAFYARFLEFGHYTRPAGGGQIPRRRFRAGFLMSGAVHQFVLPRKSLTPAFNTGGQLALEVIVETMRDSIEKLAL